MLAPMPFFTKNIINYLCEYGAGTSLHYRRLQAKNKKKKDNFLCLQENVADGAVMHYLLYRTILFLCMKIIRVNCLPSVYLCQTFFFILGHEKQCEI